MIEQDSKSSPSNWLFSAAKSVLELALLWNVLGYISLRAFCNSYNVPLLPDLGIQRYLQETYALLVGTSIREAKTAEFLIVILLITCLAAVIALIPYATVERTFHKLLGGAKIIAILFVVVLVSAFGIGRMNRHLFELEPYSLSGPLHAPNNLLGSDYYLNRALLLSVFIWVSWFVFRPHDTGSLGPGILQGQRILRGLLFLFGLIAVIYVPVLYGASLDGRDCYIVKIQMQDTTDPVVAMQIFESTSQVVYWRAENKNGIVRSIPSSKILSIEYLCSDAIAKQMRLAATGQPTPECPATNGGKLSE